jgi:hypothetical protein
MRCAVLMRCWGFDAVAAGGEVFRQLVLARIIEPVSKHDSLPCWRGRDWCGVVCDGEAPSSGVRRTVAGYRKRCHRA